MPRKTIAIEEAARAAGVPVITIPDDTLARFIKANTSVWEALYIWLQGKGHAPSVKNHDMHAMTRVGSVTMKRLLAAQRRRLRDSVRIASIDGQLRRVPKSSRVGRRPTTKELNEMLGWSNLGSGPMETDLTGRRLVGTGLYVERETN